MVSTAAVVASSEVAAGSAGSSAAEATRLGGAVRGALFLVLLKAAVELIGQKVNGRVHVLFGRIRVDRITADVQRRFRLLSQLLHRQHTVHVDDLVEMSADTFELLLHVASQ